ncbi:MAG TPA: hypothetical protein PKH07_20210 [bacterium]|nr:hypothetical protein [bacterium]
MSQEHNTISCTTTCRTEPELRAWRKRLLRRAMFLCILGIPIGLLMKLPAVWILGAIGVVVGWVKLKQMG